MIGYLILFSKFYVKIFIHLTNKLKNDANIFREVQYMIGANFTQKIKKIDIFDLSITLPHLLTSMF